MKIINIIIFFIIIGTIYCLNNIIEHYGRESTTHKHVTPEYRCTLTKTCIKKKLTYCDDKKITIPKDWDCYTDISASQLENLKSVFEADFIQYSTDKDGKLTQKNFRLMLNNDPQFSFSADEIKEIRVAFNLNDSDKIDIDTFVTKIAMLINSNSPYWASSSGYLYNNQTGKTIPIHSKSDLIDKVKEIKEKIPVPIDLDKIYPRTDNRTYNILLDDYV
jgi:hypothetical protein